MGRCTAHHEVSAAFRPWSCATVSGASTHSPRESANGSFTLQVVAVERAVGWGDQAFAPAVVSVFRNSWLFGVFDSRSSTRSVAFPPLSLSIPIIRRSSTTCRSVSSG